MLEMIDIGIDNAVAFRFGGKITEEEMKMALSTVEEKMDLYEEVFFIRRS